MPAETLLDRAKARTAIARQRVGRPLRVQRHWSGAHVLAWQLGIVLVVVISLGSGGTRRFDRSLLLVLPEQDLRHLQDLRRRWQRLCRYLVHVAGDDFGSLRLRHAQRRSNRPLLLVVAQLCARGATFSHLFRSHAKLALAPLIVLVFGTGLTSKVALGVALTMVVTTLTTFMAVRSLDPDSERLFYLARRDALPGFQKVRRPFRTALDHLLAAGQYRPRAHRRGDRRIRLLAARSRAADPLCWRDL